MKIVLISCAKGKLSYKSKAKNLYISNLFRSNLKYAESLNPDKIFILSAKHGLVDLEEELEPYELSLSMISTKERETWAKNVIRKLGEKSDLKKDEIIFLAGEKYRRYLLPYISNYKIPLKGLGFGKQLKVLKDILRCSQLHNLFGELKRYHFPFKEEEIPLNGIYVLFENGEKAHGKERIVRIGSHTGKDQLRSRLKQHFVNENKDRSIFRKNIGRAILNKEKDPFLNQWELDLTTKEAKDKFSNSINFEKQKEVEKRVSKYIQNNFNFAVMEIENKEKRLEMESKIISTVSLCKDCHASDKWLGLFSTKEKIRESGLWLVNELYKEPLNDKEIEELASINVK